VSSEVSGLAVFSLGRGLSVGNESPTIDDEQRVLLVSLTRLIAESAGY
jgi:hypothetical protein